MNSSFVHLKFKGRTTSPWYVGKRQFGDFYYTRTDFLWGRGVRGPVLRHLWRTHCPKSSAEEAARFNPNECKACRYAEECPFNQLRGSNEGEFKDRPRLIVTNLKFLDVKNTGRLALVSRSEETLSVVRGKSPVFIEYIPEGTRFEFEAILMGKGAEFEEAFVNAVKTSLRFFGWGGFCNEGFGRGEVEVERSNYEAFVKEIEKDAENIKRYLDEDGKVTFKVEPVLILEKERGGFFKSPLEAGFKEKFIHCLNERFWQFFQENIYVPITEISGVSKHISIRNWSRKEGREGKPFEGVGGEISLHLKEYKKEHLLALSVARYGIGRFKNMGFGSLIFTHKA